MRAELLLYLFPLAVIGGVATVVARVTNNVVWWFVATVCMVLLLSPAAMACCQWVAARRFLGGQSRGENLRCCGGFRNRTDSDRETLYECGVAGRLTQTWLLQEVTTAHNAEESLHDLE